MTISRVSQSLSFSAVRISINQASTAAPEAKPTSGADSVTLSAEATSGTGEAAPAGGVSTRPPVSPAAPVAKSDTERRADALFGALDADQDGSITEQEFTSGAAALLRRAGERHRAGRGHDHDHDDARSERGEERRSSRLERKLERVFGRVDGNGDGSIDTEELTSALAAAKRRPDPPAPGNPGAPVDPPAPGNPGVPAGPPAPGSPRVPADPPAPGTPRTPSAPADPPAPGSPNAPAGGGTFVSFSVSVVSIAMQRYTSLAA